MIIDYSLARPTVTALKQAGVTSVGRYIGWDGEPGFQNTHKNITAAEASALRAAGLEIFLAFEYMADAPSRGAAQGRSDAQLGLAQLGRINAPPTMGIYFAADWDVPDYAPSLPDIPANAMAKLGPIGQYFQAIKNLKYAFEVGGYGGYWVIKRLFDAGLITLGWQTVAWSGGRQDSRINLLQVVTSTPISGADTDIRQHIATVPDYGQWPRPVRPPAPVPVPVPPPAPTPSPQEEVMPIIIDSLSTHEAVVLPVPAGKTKVTLYSNHEWGTLHIPPEVRAGSNPKWASADLKPTWDLPAVWMFPAGTTQVTLGRVDPGNSKFTVEFS